MFNVKEYLAKGIIEEYCLGLTSDHDTQQLMQYCDTYPEIKNHLIHTQKAMELFSKSYQRKSADESHLIIRNSIIENLKLENLSLSSENETLPKFINISRHTDIEKLESIIKDLNPPVEYDNIYVKPLFISTEKELVLMWGKKMAPDEVHPHINESFLVLEGTMDCVVEGEVFQMKRGDFMRIPPNASHHVIITSILPAKAIRSRVLIP